MIGWLVLAAYGAGVALSIRPLARWLLRNLGETPPAEVDYVFSGAIGVIAAFLWPLILAGMIALPAVKKLSADPPPKPDQPTRENGRIEP